jgi:7SK snRNA methylphosphate capping enzyme
VSKWIHLNGGDEGLIEFFTRVFTTLHPAGRFILEPQPWSSYAKASRMSDELKQSYQTIKYRPDDFERILLEEIGFQKVEKLSEEDSGGFRRPLHVYIKAAGSWL